MDIKRLLELRAKYGRVYVTRFPKLDVPWKPLSLGEFLQYDTELRLGQTPQAHLYDEIFKRCVLDPSLAEDQSLQAGIVWVTAQNILQHSGPSGIGQLNQHLEQGRLASSAAIHEMVSWVCRAFPAYKPEEVYALPYQDFLVRVGQAEKILMQLGIIKEPFSVKGPEEKQKPSRRLAPSDLKRAWEASAKMKDIPIPGQREEKRSPILEAFRQGRAPEAQVIEAKTGKVLETERLQFSRERQTVDGGASGWDRIELEDEAQKMTTQAMLIYGDTMRELPYYKGKHIPTKEELLKTLEPRKPSPSKGEQKGRRKSRGRRA